MNVEDFWRPFEEVITSYDDLVNRINAVYEKWGRKDKLFAWRGQVDSTWPLHSSLYRRMLWTRNGVHFAERDLFRQEGIILGDLHRWGLHMSANLGRLSIMNQLAALQHYGAPTRMVDVTFNPWIGAWFAVEEKVRNGKDPHKNADSRLFAVDVTNRLINEQDNLRAWEDSLTRPWVGDPPPPKSAKRGEYLDWVSKVYAWRPPHFDGRIAAQNGGFLLGGVPLSSGPKGPNQWPKEIDSSGRKNTWTIEEVRSATSLAIRPHKLTTKHGGVSQDAVYTFRIVAQAKEDIRNRLEKQFGYKHSTVYPDFTGFSQFGTPYLHSSPNAVP